MKRNAFVKVVDCIVCPLYINFPFFINVLCFIIFPTILNAYFINRDEYISFSSDYSFGILIKYGASFPYILFIPFVLSYILSLILLLINNRVLKTIFKNVIYISLSILLVVNVFLLFNFKTMLSPSIILLLSETNVGESMDFGLTYLLDLKSILSYGVALFLFVVAYFIEKNENRLKKLTDFKTIKVLLFVVLIYMFYRSINPFQKFWGLYECDNLDALEFWYLDYRPDTNMITNVLYSFYTNHISKKELSRSRISTLSIKDKPSSEGNAIVILVIGESYNKHHSGLYGYSYNTTPCLLNEFEAGNLFVFNDVITPFNMTSYVMKNLFSLNSLMEDENWGDYPIFPIIFRKAGYSVYFWDNQKTLGKADVSDYSIFSYLYDSDIVNVAYTKCNSEVYDYDMDLIEDFFRNEKKYGSKSLLIYHLKGQHDMAENRYPHNEEYNYFTPDSVRGNYSIKQKQQIAAYDNATRYNDKVMSYLINRIKDKECVIVYLSDHGEEVHDYRNHYGRTQENLKTSDILKYQYEIPFMIWCSNLYVNNNPQIIQNIKNALDKPFMIDNTCQILFDLAQMNSSYYKPERDLLSVEYISPKTRIVQNNVIYEVVRKKVKESLQN